MAQTDTTEQTSSSDAGVIPYILSPDAKKHMEWLKTVFDAREKSMYCPCDGSTKKVLHASLDMNGGTVYFSDGSCIREQQEKSVLPAGSEVRGIVSHLNVKDPQTVWKKAISNGATVVVKLERQSWGDIYGSFRDPFGYEWALCASVEEDKTETDLSKED